MNAANNNTSGNSRPWWKRWPSHVRDAMAALAALTVAAPAALARHTPVLARTFMYRRQYRQGNMDETQINAFNNWVDKKNLKTSLGLARGIRLYSTLSGRHQAGLGMAVDLYDVKGAKRFLKKGASPEFNGLVTIFGNYTQKHRPCLLNLCEHKNARAPQQQADMAALLIDAGADPNRQDPETGKTPLHAAAVNLNPALVRLLLEKGADLATTDAKGKTPLALAQAAQASGLVYERDTLSDIIGMLENWDQIKAEREKTARHDTAKAEHGKKITVLDRINKPRSVFPKR